jgi:hypothetical protein
MSYKAAMVRDALRRVARRPILFDLDGHSRSGDEVAEGVDRLAGALAEAVGEGARVGLWLRSD